MENTKNLNEDHEPEEMLSDNQTDEMDKREEHAGAEPSATEEAAGETGKSSREVHEMKDKYLRLYSEFENFRRRTSKEKLEMIQSANEQLLVSILPVVDDFERAERALGESNGAVEGLFLIVNKLRKTLEQFGVKPMRVEKGDEFDADKQEAITQITVTDEKLKGKVVDVVEKGYLLNEKVIRYAKVVVGQ